MRCKCFAEDHAEDCDLIEALTRADADVAEYEGHVEALFNALALATAKRESFADPRAPRPSYVPAAVPPARAGKLIDLRVWNCDNPDCEICHRPH